MAKYRFRDVRAGDAFTVRHQFAGDTLIAYPESDPSHRFPYTPHGSVPANPTEVTADGTGVWIVESALAEPLIKRPGTLGVIEGERLVGE